MAETIHAVASLYKDGIIAKPKHYAYPFPDSLTFHAILIMPYGMAGVRCNRI